MAYAATTSTIICRWVGCLCEPSQQHQTRISVHQPASFLTNFFLLKNLFNYIFHQSAFLQLLCISQRLLLLGRLLMPHMKHKNVSACQWWTWWYLRYWHQWQRVTQFSLAQSLLLHTYSLVQHKHFISSIQVKLTSFSLNNENIKINNKIDCHFIIGDFNVDFTTDKLHTVKPSYLCDYFSLNLIVWHSVYS